MTRQAILWLAFLLYLVIAGITMMNHEMWADELHSWNIAKGSESFLDIFRNSRYEGHPPVWYILLWVISKFTHDLVWVQSIHLLVAAATVFIILFYSPFDLTTKLLLPFGYFFLFEFAVLSRNYAIGILIACVICVVMHKKILLYYALLLLLTNTHMLLMLLAASLHVYFLASQKKKIAHALLGILVALPAVYFILPPAESGLHAQTGGRLLLRAKAFSQTPLRSMLPLPAWWNYNWWNTQFMVDAKQIPVRIFNLTVSAAIPVISFFIFRKEKKALALFFVNFFLSAIVALTVITLHSARYAGFIFIGFVMALWLYCHERPLEAWKKKVVYTLLAVQSIAGFFAVIKDVQFPFSNSNRILELVKQVPPGKQLVCDYWAVNSYSAFIDQPVYAIDLQGEASFILFDSRLRRALQLKNRYTEGLKMLNDHEVYMISTHPPELLSQIDSQLKFVLIDKKTGAIEKFSNLYLYFLSL